MLLSQVLKAFYVLPMGQSEIVGFDASGNLLRVWWADSETGMEHFQRFLDQEIQESWPIVRGDFVVMDTNGEACGFIALDGADLSPKENTP